MLCVEITGSQDFDQHIAEARSCSLEQRLSHVKGLTVSIAQIRHENGLVDAAVELCPLLVLICHELQHVLVKDGVTLCALVDLKLKDIHVDVRTYQVVLAFL